MRIEISTWTYSQSSKYSFKGQTQKMRIEIPRMGDLQEDPARFQRSNSENEDWNAKYGEPRLTIPLVSKVKLRKWGLKSPPWSFDPPCQDQVSKVKLRKWGLKCIQDKGLPVRWFVSKVKLRKWGLKSQFSIFNWIWRIRFQRSNSENEDWNPRHTPPRVCRFPCFKGQTQKMRIEIVHPRSVFSYVAGFQRSNSENEDWNLVHTMKVSQ